MYTHTSGIICLDADNSVLSIARNAISRILRAYLSSIRSKCDICDIIGASPDDTYNNSHNTLSI